MDSTIFTEAEHKSLKDRFKGSKADKTNKIQEVLK
jgi:hypothetical protein